MKPTANDRSRSDFASMAGMPSPSMLMAVSPILPAAGLRACCAVSAGTLRHT